MAAPNSDEYVSEASMITQERLKELFHYNPKTGIFSRKVSNSNRVHVGDISGSLGSKGYLRIRIDYKEYLAHRLAWFYVNGHWPEHEIDHINHNRSDNRINNLREVTHRENCKNMPIPRNNNSGYVGVRWHKLGKKWEAHITIENKQIYLGLFINMEDAIASRKQAEIKYDFHTNHGRRHNCRCEGDPK